MNAIDSLQYTPFLSGVQPPSVWKRMRDWCIGLVGAAKFKPEGDPSNYSRCDPHEQLNAYKTLLPDAKAIYVFRNGTAVFAATSISENQAIEIMRDFGRIHAGTPDADFYVAKTSDPILGYVVKYAHPSILYENDYLPDAPLHVVGCLVRHGRHMDAYDLHIVASYTGSL